MEDYIISCCSTVDLSKKHLESRNIHYICFHFELDGKEYKDDFGESLSFDDLYQAMRQGSETKTSQINAMEYEEYFEEFLKEGKDILHVTISSGVSGAYNSANIAKQNLQEKYPERKIYIVDSLGGSSGSGLLIDEVADLRDKGKTIDEILEWIIQNRLKVHHWLFSTDLTFFIKGGRISKTAGIVGTILNICPMINVDREGKMVPRYKVRGKKKAVEALVKQMKVDACEGENYDGRCFICHSGCLEDAKEVARVIKRHFSNIKGEVIINNIGTAIGAHSGPGTIGLFFWGNERK